MRFSSQSWHRSSGAILIAPHRVEISTGVNGARVSALRDCGGRSLSRAIHSGVLGVRKGATTLLVGLRPSFTWRNLYVTIARVHTLQLTEASHPMKIIIIKSKQLLAFRLVSLVLCF